MPSIRNILDTWNNALTTFTAFKINVTDTASAGDSKLLDLQVGGTSKFSVDKDGAVGLSGTSGLITDTDIASTAEIRNKTADKLVYVDGVYTALAPVALADGATITFDCDLRFNGSVILDGNRTLNFTNPQAWQSGILDVSQDGVTGGRTLAVQVTGGTGTILGTTPTLSTATDARDLLGYLFVSATEVILWVVELDV